MLGSKQLWIKINISKIIDLRVLAVFSYMATNNKKSHNPRLSLVKGGAQAAQLQVVSLENLSEDAAGLLNNYLEFTKARGKCVGALIGAEDWDVRPLLIENDHLTVTRFFDPLLHESSDIFGLLKSYIEIVKNSDEISKQQEFGAHENYVWLRRTFHKSTMLDNMPFFLDMTSAEKKQMFIALLEQVKKNHQSGLIHGNICPSNIAWNFKQPIMLDFGSALFSMHKNLIASLAPEIKKGMPATQASDIFGLGRTIEEFIGDVQSLPMAEMISSMKNENPEERPQINDVLDFFNGKKKIDRQDLLKASIVEQKIEVAPGITMHEDSAESKTNYNFVYALIVLGLICIYYYAVVFRGADVTTSYYDDLSYTELWNSSQPSMMQVVALDAIEKGERMAQALIIKDALAGNKANFINNNLLRVVFDPRWEASLSNDDRKIALILATTGLFPQNIPALPNLSEANPIVLLAIAGTLQIETPVKDLAKIPLQTLSALHKPLGAAFQELAVINNAGLDHVTARALSHIVLGNISEPVIAKFFSQVQNDVEIFRMTRVLLPVIDLHEGFDMRLHAFLISRSRVFAQAYRWFEDDAFAEWNNVPRSQRISIVTGVFPSTRLTFERYADLLRHPNPRISQESAQRINAEFFAAKQGEILAFLASDQNNLSRHQTISFLAAWPLKGKEASDFFAKWFAGAPDAESILKLLLLRNNVEKDDVFNFAAAHYLSDKPWQATHDNLRKLVLHPETLARALAYAKLDKKRLEDVQLLKTMAIAEPNARLREQIQKILQ